MRCRRPSYAEMRRELGISIALLVGAGVSRVLSGFLTIETATKVLGSSMPSSEFLLGWLIPFACLGGQGLAENTSRRRCGIARQFFRAAIKHRLLIENPFSDMEDGVAVKASRTRDYFLGREDAAKVLKACPDAQWKLLFALSRYGAYGAPQSISRSAGAM